MNDFRHEKSKEKLTIEEATAMWNSMGSDERAPYMPVEEEGLSIKCSLSTFNSLVKDCKLNSSIELRDSPFRFLLNLKKYELDTVLIHKLVSEFDINDTSLKVDDKSYKISLHDFDDILKIGKTDFSKKKRVPLPDELVSRFTSKSNNDVCMKKVREILEKKEDKDDFKRAFALACLRFVVCAPTRGKLCKNFLHYVVNIEDLNSQPWAGLAMKYLKDGISAFQKQKGKILINLGGSMVFLQLYHADRVMGMKIKELINSDEVSDLKQDTMIEKMEEAETSKNKDDCYTIAKEGDDIMEQVRLLNCTIYSMFKFPEENDASIEKWFKAAPDQFGVRLLKFCFTMVGDTRCVASSQDGGAFGIEMRFFKTLRPNQWLSVDLVNHVADILSVRQKLKRDIQRWYFPTVHRDFRLAGCKRVSRLFYIERQQLKAVKQIFFPLHKFQHFYLIVFNNEEKQVEVWDTLKRNHVDEYEQDIDDLCQFLDERTQGDEFPFKQYTRILAKVPQQDKDSMDDCGVFVCRSMEYPDEVMNFHKQKWIGKKQRLDLALRILQARENIHSDKLWKECNKKNEDTSSSFLIYKRKRN